MFKTLEQVNERIITRANPFGRLKEFVTTRDTRERGELRTDSKRPTPANIAFAGRNCCGNKDERAEQGKEVSS